MLLNTINYIVQNLITEYTNNITVNTCISIHELFVTLAFKTKFPILYTTYVKEMCLR